MNYKIYKLKQIVSVYAFGVRNRRTGDCIYPHSFDIPDKCIKDIISLCDKEIGKPPKVDEVWQAGITSFGYCGKSYVCSNCDCGLRVGKHYLDKFCPNCGLRVDWASVLAK